MISNQINKELMIIVTSTVEVTGSNLAIALYLEQVSAKHRLCLLLLPTSLDLSFLFFLHIGSSLPSVPTAIALLRGLLVMHY